MRLLVCGGRFFHDALRLNQVLNGIADVTVLIEGGADGADRLARKWAQRNRVPVESYPALWGVYGNGAGPIRNSLMLEQGKPDFYVAFPGGAGTADMVAKLSAANIPGINLLKKGHQNV